MPLGASWKKSHNDYTMYSDVHHRLPARLKCWVSLAFDYFFFLFESDEILLFVIVWTWNSVALMIPDQVLFWIPKNTFIVLWFAWETRAKYSQIKIIIEFVLEFIFCTPFFPPLSEKWQNFSLFNSILLVW